STGITNKLNSLSKRFGFSSLFGPQNPPPNPLSDLIAAEPGVGDGGDGPDQFSADALPPLLDTIFSGGPNGFSLADIGTTITTLTGLRDALDGLDSIPNNVTLTTQGSAQILDITVDKTIQTGASLNFSALSGAFTLAGDLNLSVDVAFHL